MEFSNDWYDLAYNPGKNRLYFTIKGFWPSTAVVPDFLDHWKQCLAASKENLTAMIDTSTMITHPADVNELHREAQQLMIAAGLRKRAEIVAASTMTKIFTKELCKKTGIKEFSKRFPDKQEAEKWLDEE